MNIYCIYKYMMYSDENMYCIYKYMMYDDENITTRNLLAFSLACC